MVIAITVMMISAKSPLALSQNPAFLKALNKLNFKLKTSL
jgi:hypothetical protein